MPVFDIEVQVDVNNPRPLTGDSDKDADFIRRGLRRYTVQVEADTYDEALDKYTELMKRTRIEE